MGAGLSLVMHAAGSCWRSPAGQRRRSKPLSSLAALLSGSVISAGLLGCGNSYRPVVTAINPVGPAGQPTKYAVAISNPTTTGPGLVTFVDFSGDSILITATIGNAPYYLALDSTGSTGYTLNNDRTINSFSISTSLLANDVLSSSLLPSTPRPASILIPGSNVYITEPGRSLVAQFATTTSPPSLRQELPVAVNPIYIAGIAGASRIYAISQGDGVTPGQVAAIENSTTTPTISNTINVGVNPVYGIMTADSRRVFIMNKGSDTVSVINSQTNALDVTTPSVPVGIAPVWGDLITVRNEVAVLNAGNGTTPGSLTLINTALCSAVAQPNNPTCDPNNPIDSVNFGQVLANIPVGINPQFVAVLADGTRAYVANTGSTVACPTTIPKAAALLPTSGCGSISVVNLQTNTVEATIPVAGHPTFLAATSGTPTGKVYVTSNETSLMTVLRTDVNQVQTYIELQGRGGQVRVTAQ